MDGCIMVSCQVLNLSFSSSLFLGSEIERGVKDDAYYQDDSWAHRRDGGFVSYRDKEVIMPLLLLILFIIGVIAAICAMVERRGG